ncbi:unnamed protein product [Knipowitschia caucasica]|uniref:Regulator of microtubule dynamics protein 1 n=1 Tax=Knipowitschia caucasica TaxID=637954 RepID=A0AAV2L4T0_KNICA
MAAAAVTGLSNTFLSVYRSKNIYRRAVCYLAAARRTTHAIKRGKWYVLLAVPAVGLLGLELQMLQRQRPAAVLALDRVELLEQADYLYSCAETDKLYQLLVQQKDREDVDFLWRLARATRDLALLPETSADRKKTLLYEAFEVAKRALAKDDKCYAAHKWYAICLSDMGDYEGVKVKLGNSYIIRDHLQKAIELNPKDATSMHILGYWCFVFADLPWYQRKMAAVIFATPPTATFEEALEHFLKAEEVDPNFFSKNLLMLGQTYLKIKDKINAKVWLEKAKAYPPLTHEDKQVQKEAIDLLKTLG